MRPARGRRTAVCDGTGPCRRPRGAGTRIAVSPPRDPPASRRPVGSPVMGRRVARLVRARLGSRHVRPRSLADLSEWRSWLLLVAWPGPDPASTNDPPNGTAAEPGGWPVERPAARYAVRGGRCNDRPGTHPGRGHRPARAGRTGADRRVPVTYTHQTLPPNREV